MAVSAALIDELEGALKDGSNNKRIEVLEKVTSLFLTNASNFSEEHTDLFDIVLTRLINHIETKATAELSRQLASLPNAPPATILKLAHSDDIETAGPVLATSPRLSDFDLVEIAQTKGQAHLSRIAIRSQLAESVTDAVIDRADANVVNAMATNAGARFSEGGMVKLVIKAEGDDRLTEAVGLRSDLSPHLFRQVLRRASDKARKKLLTSAKVQERLATQKIINNILAELQQQSTSLNYRAAKDVVRAIGKDSVRLKAQLKTFASEEKLAEMIVALSEIAAFPLELVESLFFDKNLVGVLVLCKAINLDWLTVFAIISARPNQERVVPFREVEEMYAKMTPSSAQRTMRFWQSREKIVI